MAKPRLLIVDDEEGVRDAFRLALGDEQIEVQTAASGPEGIDKALAARPDLVILDIRMPGINGIETMCRLQALLPGLKVSILTAFHEEFMQDLKAAFDRGCCFELIRKPLDLHQIRTLVHGLLPDRPRVEPE